MDLLLFYNDWVAFLPEFFLIVCINVVILYSVIYCTSPVLDFPLMINNTFWLSLQILLFILLLNIFNSFDSILIFNNSLIIDRFGTSIKCFILLSTICVIFISLRYTKIELINNFEYSVIVLLNVLGIFLVISSSDLLSIYLAVELQSFCSYILSAFKRTSEFSTEAGLKYFILGAFSSGFLLFGFSLIYGFLGTSNYNNLSLILISLNSLDPFYNGVLLGITFILISFLFKFSASPFHMWSPDIYEGSPTIVTAFFAIVPKLSLIVLFLRLFFGSFYSCISSWQLLIIVSSCLSMIVGSLGALWQVKLKRLLAFSAIGHVGYMLLGLCCNSIESVFSVIFYSVVYIFLSISSFSLLLIMRKNKSGSRIKYIEDIGVVARVNPFIGITFVVTFFSIAGIPPLAGFFSKTFIFFNAVSHSLYFLAFFGVVTSVISCFYYLRIIQTAYFEQINSWITVEKVNKEIAFVISISVLFLVVFFFHPLLLITFINNSVLNFYIHCY